MFPLKQSTSFEVSFFAHDASGDAVAGLLDGGFTKRIKKQAGSWAAMTITIAEEENGWYKGTLSTSHSDTLGGLYVTFTHASCKQINMMFRVHVRLPDDLAFPATSGRSIGVESDGHVHADLKEWLGLAPNALSSSRVDVTVGVMGNNVLTAAAIASGAITADKFNTDAIDANALAADAATEIASGIFTTQLTESYAAAGVAPTAAQALFMTMQAVLDFAVSGATLTVRKLDGSTTAMTFTLNDTVNPTDRTRAS